MFKLQAASKIFRFNSFSSFRNQLRAFSNYGLDPKYPTDAVNLLSPKNTIRKPVYPNISKVKHETVRFKPKGFKQSDLYFFFKSEGGKISSQPHFIIKAQKWAPGSVFKDSKGRNIKDYRLLILNSTDRVCNTEVSFNQAKRRIRNAFQILYPKFKTQGIDYAVYIRQNPEKAKWDDICNQIQNAMVEIRDKLYL